MKIVFFQFLSTIKNYFNNSYGNEVNENVLEVWFANISKLNSLKYLNIDL